MRKIAEVIVRFMTKYEVISTETDVLEFYTYGVEITVSSILNIVLVLLLGLILHDFTNAMIFLIVFIFVRSMTGGFHADTYFRCNLLMCVSFTLLSIMTAKLYSYMTILVAVVIYVLVIAAILGLCPVENVNKPIPKENRLGLKVKGIIVCTALTILSVWGIIYQITHATMVLLTMLWIAILVIAAKIKERRQNL